MAHILIAGFQDNYMVKNSCKQINLQKTLEIEQVFVPSQYLEGVGNHICHAPNALKTP